jgi:ABC-type spermidine/putrescine transport system permease subunit II
MAKVNAVEEREHERTAAETVAAPSPADLPRWLRKWGLLVLCGFCLLLLPWTIYLVYSLPSRHVTPHWSVVWAGFDVMMAFVALWTIVAILRQSTYVAIAASVTGTLLLCDAWFDLLTSRPGSELLESSLMAVAGEVPLAILCFWIAFDAERVCQRTARYWKRRRSGRLRVTA